MEMFLLRQIGFDIINGKRPFKFDTGVGGGDDRNTCVVLATESVMGMGDVNDVNVQGNIQSNLH